MRDARLLLARRPPSCNLTSFIMDATGGYPSGVWYSPSAFTGPHPATRPRRRTAITGSSLHGGPPMNKNVQHRTYRNLCCTKYDACGTDEARTGPGPLYPRNGKRPHTTQGTCGDTCAGSQQRAALRGEGDGTVPGSDQPAIACSPRHQRGGLSSGAHAFHQSPHPVPAGRRPP